MATHKKFFLTGWSVFLFALLFAFLLHVTFQSFFDLVSLSAYLMGAYGIMLFMVCLNSSSVGHWVAYKFFFAESIEGEKYIKDSYVANMQISKLWRPYVVIATYFVLFIIPWVVNQQLMDSYWFFFGWGPFVIVLGYMIGEALSGMMNKSSFW